MQTSRLNTILCGFWLACLAFVPWRDAVAIEGVGDTVIITADLTQEAKWARELEQWTQAIDQARQQVERTNALIDIVGDPQKVMDQLIGSVPDLMQPLDDAIGLETRLEALKASQSLYGLDSVAVETYNNAKKVAGSYEAYGEKIKRDPKRFAHYAMQEALLARYKRAAENEEKVVKKEADVQKQALDALKLAKTETEVALFNAQIAASKQRQEIAHQKSVQAKGELDAFQGHLLVEDAKKADADREWAQTVVDRMRSKALAAYQAQVGGAPAP